MQKWGTRVYVRGSKWGVQIPAAWVQMVKAYYEEMIFLAKNQG